MADGQIESNKDAGENGLFNVALAAGAIFLGVGAAKGLFKKGAKQGVKEAAKGAEKIAAAEGKAAAASVAKGAEATAKTSTKSIMSKADMFKMQDIADEIGYTGFAEAGSKKEAQNIAQTIFNDAKGDMDTARKIMEHKTAQISGGAQNVTNASYRNSQKAAAEAAKDTRGLGELSNEEFQALKNNSTGHRIKKL